MEGRAREGRQAGLRDGGGVIGGTKANSEDSGRRQGISW